MNDQPENRWTRARDYAEEKASAASEQVREISSLAKENAAAAYETSREKAGQLAEQAKGRGAQLLRENPLAVVAGALALGVVIGALAPKRKGSRVGATLAAGVMAAKGMRAAATSELTKAASKIREKIDDIDTDAARTRLNELADTDRARARLSDALEKASEAVSSAGRSAASKLRKK